MELSQASTRDLVNAPIGNPEDHSEVDDTINGQEDLLQDLRDEIEAIENYGIDEPPDEDANDEPPDDDGTNGPPKKKYKFRDRKCVAINNLSLTHFFHDFFLASVLITPNALPSLIPLSFHSSEPDADAKRPH